MEPEAAEIGILQRRLGDDFYVVADDAMWYRAAAYELLDSLGVAHETVARGEADFRVGSELRRFSWADAEPIWFLVVYDGRTEPSIVHDVDLPNQVHRLRR